MAPLVAAAQAPVDPQSLLGEWKGSWISRNGSVSGGYHLTVEKVVGAAVSGRWEVTTPRQGDRRATFVGALDGDRLSWGDYNRFTVEPSRMRGVIGVAGHMSVTLTKQ